MPLRQRSGREFDDLAHELARMLGLTDEWWTGCSVLDKRSGPIHASLEYMEYHDWHRCREVRRALMAALAASKAR